MSEERAKILLVDDRPENLLALEAILQSLDHQLVKANSGEEALKRLLADDFALILLDVQMPGMDGFETAAHIKARERTRHIPIVFLTAIDREPAHAFRGYAAGAVDYLAKPFDPWVLRAKVAVFVDLFEKTRLLAAQAEQLRQQLDRVSPAAPSHDPEAVPSSVASALERVEGLLRDASDAVGSEPRESVAELLSDALDEVRHLRAHSSAGPRQ